MRIKVYLPSFVNYEQVDEKGFVTLEEGSTLRDLFRRLSIRFAFGAVVFCRVNYERAKLNTVLKEGDVVSFFSPLSGG